LFFFFISVFSFFFVQKAQQLCCPLIGEAHGQEQASARNESDD
jgi:hypothetical protein